MWRANEHQDLCRDSGAIRDSNGGSHASHRPRRLGGRCAHPGESLVLAVWPPEVQAQGRSRAPQLHNSEAPRQRHEPRPPPNAGRRQGNGTDAPRDVRPPRLRELLAARQRPQKGRSRAHGRVYLQDLPPPRPGGGGEERDRLRNLGCRTRLGIRQGLRAVPETGTQRLAPDICGPDARHRLPASDARGCQDGTRRHAGGNIPQVRSAG